MKAALKRSTPSEAKTLVDRVYHEIQNRILYNVWAPGHQALEQELAHELGVSRTPVREALIRLQREGLVKVVPRHGMRVLPISLQDVQEIYQILTSLEALACELAAARKPVAKEMKAIERAAAQMQAAQEAADLKAWARADEEFHVHLVELSGNRILVDVVDSFWGRAQRARLTLLSLRKITETSTRDHAKLLSAIRDGDSALARATLEEHRHRGASNLTVLMDRNQSILDLR